MLSCLTSLLDLIQWLMQRPIMNATSTNGSSAALNNVSATNMSGGGSINDKNSTRHVVSLFLEQGGTTNKFPSQYLCPFLLGETPVDGTYFNVPGTDNQISMQAFEYLQLTAIVVVPVFSNIQYNNKKKKKPDIGHGIHIAFGCHMYPDWIPITKD
jgi:hypothetical protein